MNWGLVVVAVAIVLHALATVRAGESNFDLRAAGSTISIFDRRSGEIWITDVEKIAEKGESEWIALHFSETTE